MIRLILLFYAVVAVVSLCSLLFSWIEDHETRLPYREPIHRRW